MPEHSGRFGRFDNALADFVEGVNDATVQEVLRRAVDDPACRETLIAQYRLHRQLQGLARRRKGAVDAQAVLAAVGDRHQHFVAAIMADVRPIAARSARGRWWQPRRRSWPWMAAALAATLILAVLAFRPGTTTTEALRLVAVAGNVQLAGQPAQAGTVLAAGQALDCSDGGSATLVYGDGTEVVVDAGARCLVETVAPAKHLLLAHGVLRAQVAHQPDGRPMVIASARTTCTVIGTRLRFTAGDDRDRLEVEEGRVQALRHQDRSLVEVAAGRQVEVRDRGPLVLRPAGPNGTPGAETGAFAVISDGSLIDSGLRYIGRWDRSDPKLFHSNWAGGYLRAAFTGTRVGFKGALSRSGGHGQVLVSIDGEPLRPVPVNIGVDKIAVVDLTTAPLRPGEHTLVLAAPADGGRLAFQGLVLEPGASTRPVAERPVIEFIGDAASALGGGAGDDPSGNYTWRTAEMLACDHVRIAYPGAALADGCGFTGNPPVGMARQSACTANYEQPLTPWQYGHLPPSYAPSAVVINLGQHDVDPRDRQPSSDEAFAAAALELAQRLRAQLPHAHLFLMRPFSGLHEKGVRQAVERLNRLGDRRVHLIDTSAWLERGVDCAQDEGALPNLHGHMRIAARLAPILLPYVSNPDAQVLTRFRRDALGPAAMTGWRCWWNPRGVDIATPTGFLPLSWDGGRMTPGSGEDPTAADLALGLAPASGRPGTGSRQATDGRDHYAIAAYTIPTGTAGRGWITDGSILRHGERPGSMDVRVAVGNALVHSAVVRASGRATAFTADLGQVTAGDTVYVAIGPDGDDDGDIFTCDFAISLLPDGQRPTPTRLLVKPPADQPAMRLREDGSPDGEWLASHQRFIDAAARGGIDVLFVGDTAAWGWPSDSTDLRRGKDVWDKLAGFNPAAFGQPGDTTAHLLWRLANGEIDVLKPPRVVVLCATTADVRLHGGEEVARGVAAMVRTVRHLAPTTRVLVLGVGPRGGDGQDGAAVLKQLTTANAIIAKLDDGRQVRFLDLTSTFLTSGRAIPPEILADRPQLVPGYATRYERVIALLKTMVKP